MHSRLNIPAPAGIKAVNDAWKDINYPIESGALASAEAHGWGRCREKLMGILRRPYRKPTQVGECKRTQARERNLSKELGTLAP